MPVQCYHYLWLLWDWNNVRVRGRCMWGVLRVKKTKKNCDPCFWSGCRLLEGTSLDTSAPLHISLTRGWIRAGRWRGTRSEGFLKCPFNYLFYVVLLCVCVCTCSSGPFLWIALRPAKCQLYRKVFQATWCSYTELFLLFIVKWMTVRGQSRADWGG